MIVFQSVEKGEPVLEVKTVTFCRQQELAITKVVHFPFDFSRPGMLEGAYSSELPEEDRCGPHRVEPRISVYLP